MREIKKCLAILSVMVLLAACSSGETPSIEQGKKGHHNASGMKEPMHIMIVGIDTRGEDKSRSDAILVGQYDEPKRTIKIVSLMRDTYVRIPGYQKGYHKLNTAYYLGGKELLAKTIQQNFGLKIDHSAVIDFKGFTEVVDAIAPEGIELDVSEEMIADMKMEMEPGLHMLHGRDVLKYVRFRHDDDNDFGRVKRQQEVLVKLKDTMTADLSSLQQMAAMPKLVEGALKYIETDIGLGESLALATSLLMHKVDSVETMTIPIANGFENKTYDHAGAVLQIDRQKNINALNDFFSKSRAVTK
ncbi:LCP family protein [Bacillus testis]|uniref:LCP family protein n=1 Tax=Bacillus testis TaxID=1622072 RepID=UPI00067ECD5A|nr:LCP family protein [Bacillus testis]